MKTVNGGCDAGYGVTARLGILLAVFLPAALAAQGAGTISWDPAASTHDGVPFVELEAGVGAIQLGFPGPSNPAGTGFSGGGVFAFGFATAVPGEEGPAMAETDLGASPLTAGTELVLRFNKGEDDHISFVAMLADASDLSNIGVKVISPTVLEIKATIVDPIVSEGNNPDGVDAAFGLIMQVTPDPGQSFSFGGTVFVTDMHWLDLDALALTELPQAPGTDVAGFAAGIAAQGVSAVIGNAANFTAFMPEAFFAFARSQGVEVTGETCLGYRAYVELTGSDEGFHRLNDPPSQPVTDESFDIDGLPGADPQWRFRITNSQWSRQALMFGQVGDSEPVPTAFERRSWGEAKDSSR